MGIALSLLTGSAITSVVSPAQVSAHRPNSFVGLQVGSRGPSVEALQRALMAKGSYVHGGVDGIFGWATAYSVKAFQQVNGLSRTGRVDASTARLLGLGRTNSGSTAGAVTSSSAGTIRQGATGDVVRSIQRAIVRAGGFLLGGVDGVYGPGTASGVRAYQIVNRLPVTGIVDSATARIMGISLRGGGSTPSRHPSSSALRLGSRGESVRVMQRALINSGIYVLGGADGVFGAATESALKSFQQRKGLRATGVYDAATRQALGSSSSGGGGGGVPRSGNYVGLKQGDRGAGVREVQQAIMRTGMYLMGGADGIFGAATTSALKLYQRTNGITVSGVVDSSTAKVMGLGSGTGIVTPGTGETASGYPVYGERGARVVALQRALGNRGVSFAGGADGIFGSATTGAVVSFQQTKGIRASGRVDQATADALGLSAMQAPQTPTGNGIRLEHVPVQGPCWFGDSWQAPRGAGRYHLGVDIVADRGKEVYAVVSGRIIQKYWDQPGSLSGNGVKIATKDGTYFFYAHFDGFPSGIKVGSYVSAGDVVGYIGSTGNSAGPHLHLEVHPQGGSAVNPYPIVKASGGC
ncbi:MAG: peptidoglycan-binding protein [Actinomycetota bacterium]|nr:peptidoglycan-binding protein [Actinomycetota bacterium]